MQSLGIVLVAVAVIVLLATWVVYPLALRLTAGRAARRTFGTPHAAWPTVTIVVVVRNAEDALRQLLQNLLSLAYPPERRMVLVVSDASNDFTDAVARTFTDKGVMLLRTTWPRGTDTALNLARRWIRTDVTVVVDPAARLRPWSLAALVAPFTERSVGVVYGRDVPEESGPERARSEGRYFRYETALRDLETRLFGTVTTRGALYAARTALFRAPVPAWLNPDFATSLTAREHGYRCVYQADAECIVPRAASVRWTYGPKVDAVSRDVATLMDKRHLLNPRRYGAFAWMLLGHRLGHWLTPWAAALGIVGLALLASGATWALVVLLALLAVGALGLLAALAERFPARGAVRALAVPGRAIASAVAFAHASLRALFEPAYDRPPPYPPVSRPALRAMSL